MISKLLLAALLVGPGALANPIPNSGIEIVEERSTPELEVSRQEKPRSLLASQSASLLTPKPGVRRKVTTGGMADPSDPRARARAILWR